MRGKRDKSIPTWLHNLAKENLKKNKPFRLWYNNSRQSWMGIMEA